MSKSITLKAYAKINLVLDITGKLENGYHSINTVFQSVSMCDMISVSLNNTGCINISCDTKEIPTDKKNIAYKAAEKFFEYVKCSEFGADIRIWKGIPSQAGLGGGSADAAAVLKALNMLTMASLTDEQLCEIGAEIGADVPFCVIGGTIYAEGIGEELEVLPSLSNVCKKFICIAKGQDGVSTVEAYKNYDNCEDIVHPNTEVVVSSIRGKQCEKLYSQLSNVFEQVIDIADVETIKKIMLQCEAEKSVMTGSGSAVFGVFNSMREAEACAEQLKSKGFLADVCKFKGCGVEIVAGC